MWDHLAAAGHQERAWGEGEGAAAVMPVVLQASLQLMYTTTPGAACNHNADKVYAHQLPADCTVIALKQPSKCHNPENGACFLAVLCTLAPKHKASRRINAKAGGRHQKPTVIIARSLLFQKLDQPIP